MEHLSTDPLRAWVNITGLDEQRLAVDRAQLRGEHSILGHGPGVGNGSAVVRCEAVATSAIVRDAHIDVDTHARDVGLQHMAIDVFAVDRWQAAAEQRCSVEKPGGHRDDGIIEALQRSALFIAGEQVGFADECSDRGVARDPERAQVFLKGQVGGAASGKCAAAVGAGGRQAERQVAQDQGEWAQVAAAR
ncbi:hypothetical protein D3C75_929220 [compost metagenome]